MDVTGILAQLRAERAELEEAILSLERLARGRGKRRGRPPEWLSNEHPEVRKGDPPIPSKPSGGGSGAPPAAAMVQAPPFFREQKQNPESQLDSAAA
jgi:hypothetical protein